MMRFEPLPNLRVICYYVVLFTAAFDSVQQRVQCTCKKFIFLFQ